ncbi:MAG: hypothetical protein KKA81_04735 [Bacteroidetes bacterium]|nr:hypothetical protein [Bacteroidota bacterium]
MNKTCPNYKTCRLVTTVKVMDDNVSKLKYIEHFCKGEGDPWEGCKRFVTKNRYDLCPDFVLPDSTMSPEEILDKFEEEIVNNN